MENYVVYTILNRGGAIIKNPPVTILAEDKEDALRKFDSMVKNYPVKLNVTFIRKEFDFTEMDNCYKYVGGNY